MNIIKYAIEKPVAVVVGIILLVLFGFIGLKQMPYQLTPSVVEPEISVTTTWQGATPYEIEREIIEEQEKVLKGVTGLKDMESSSYNGRGEITLRFPTEIDINDALLRVSNKLNEVRSYPENVDKPVIDATGAATSPVIWMIFKTQSNNPRLIYTYKTFFENEVEQYLERVEGVASLLVRGGTNTEMQIYLIPERLAAYGLTVFEVLRILQSENINVSAGTMDLGRRLYRIRTVAQFNSPQEISRVALKSTGEKRVLLSDVATVGYGYEKLTDTMMYNGEPAMAVGVKPAPGANILDLTDRVEKVVQWLNEEKLHPNKVHLEWVYDQRPYIQGAIDLVKHDIMIGSILAIFMLFIFLRSFLTTVVVAVSIPISVIGTFIFMHFLGRTLNVVSLAGISFAIGMFIDNTIVVLDNIDRHRTLGKSAFDACSLGAQEVWGAVLASCLTNVAVFLPVIFIKEEVGQLFGDIAVAVTFSNIISLFVSVLVIPMLSYKLFQLTEKEAKKPKKDPFYVAIGNLFSSVTMTFVNLGIRNWFTRLVVISFMIFFSLYVSKALFPKMEYLPQGNRNLVINILIPPPGLSYQERLEIGRHIFQTAKPYYDKSKDGLPGIKRMFYIGAESFMLFGAISVDEQRAGELIPFFSKIINTIPSMFGVSQQAGIFETRIGRGRTIEVNLSADSIEQTIKTAGALFFAIKSRIPNSQVRPVPSLEALFPEVKIIPSRENLKAVGMDAASFGVAVDVLMEGRKIGDYKEEGKKKVDLILKSSEQAIKTPEELYNALIAAPVGKLIPLSSLSELVRTTGITEIRHLERQRTISLEVTPPPDLPVQEAMEIIDNQLVAQLREQGALKGVNVSMSGVADKLTQTRKTLQWNFIIAALIVFLLMAALFSNFFYPFLIMLTVPLATVGGFIGLKLVNMYIAPQPLDILTMLGFVILIGVVANNAILIVHQALNNIEYGMNHKEAVLDSTKTRLRPIYMSALTSIAGMLPLVVAPGPGSELYRGIGSVLLGGLAVSTFFTVFMIPALLMFVIKMEKIQNKEA
jgi:HAE1 family hydrophobic/amphiphilic exporter-1